MRMDFASGPPMPSLRLKQELAMIQSKRHPPWTFYAGIGTAVIGFGLLIGGRIGDGLPLTLAFTGLLVGAVIELAASQGLRREGGAWMSQLFSSVLMIGVATFMVRARLFDPRVISPGPVAMLLGIFCLCNALFRAMDLLFDRPRSLIFGAIDTAVTFGIGFLLLGAWRGASEALVCYAAGLELLAGGLAMSACASMAWRHPELSAYVPDQVPSGRHLAGFTSTL
jgi:uncharacterized membrane protein HdeD (DUF308 family)